MRNLLIGALASWAMAPLCVFAQMQFDVGVPKHLTTSSISDVAAADFDGDRRLDLFIVQPGSGSLLIMRGLGGSSWSRRSLRVPRLSHPSRVAAGDVDGDGDVDVIVGDPVSQSLWILENDGIGRFEPGDRLLVGSAVGAVACDDVTGDGFEDIIVALPDSSQVRIYANDGEGVFSPRGDEVTGGVPGALATGDLNLDGLIDVVVCAAADGKVDVLLNLGEGSLAAPVPYVVGILPRAILCEDVDGDGYPDIITGNQGSRDVTLILSSADYRKQSIVVGLGVTALATGDFDLDGRIDLAAGSDSGNVRMLVQTADGEFERHRKTVRVSSVVAMGGADLNADGREDFWAATQPGSASLVVAMNVSQEEPDAATGSQARRGGGGGVGRGAGQSAPNQRGARPGRSASGETARGAGAGRRPFIPLGKGFSVPPDPRLDARFVFRAGIKDGFGAEVPSGAETSWVHPDWRDPRLKRRHFDEGGINRTFVHSFRGLPENPDSMRLVARVRPTGKGHGTDTLHLGLLEDGTWAFEASLHDVLGERSGWSRDSGLREFVIDLDLAMLSTRVPLSLLVSRTGRLDVMIQDDTEVDYLELGVGLVAEATPYLRLDHTGLAEGTPALLTLDAMLGGSGATLLVVVHGSDQARRVSSFESSEAVPETTIPLPVGPSIDGHVCWPFSWSGTASPQTQIALQVVALGPDGRPSFSSVVTTPIYR